MDEKNLKYLYDKVQEHIDSLTQAVSMGTVADFAAYRELCGRIRGLRDAQDHINDLVQKLRKNQDDD